MNVNDANKVNVTCVWSGDRVYLHAGDEKTTPMQAAPAVAAALLDGESVEPPERRGYYDDAAKRNVAVLRYELVNPHRSRFDSHPRVVICARCRKPYDESAPCACAREWGTERNGSIVQHNVDRAPRVRFVVECDYNGELPLGILADAVRTLLTSGEDRAHVKLAREALRLVALDTVDVKADEVDA